MKYYSEPAIEKVFLYLTSIRCAEGIWLNQLKLNFRMNKAREIVNRLYLFWDADCYLV